MKEKPNAEMRIFITDQMSWWADRRIAKEKEESQARISRIEEDKKKMLETTREAILKASAGWPKRFEHQFIMIYGFDPRYKPLLELNKKIAANIGKLMVIMRHENVPLIGGSWSKGTCHIRLTYYVSRITGELRLLDSTAMDLLRFTLVLFPYRFGVPGVDWVEILIGDEEIAAKTSYPISQDIKSSLDKYLELERQAAEQEGLATVGGS